MTLHAGLIARFDTGRWRGALIMGPSGAGKSDLALRAALEGWMLVADDRTRVWTSGGGLYGAPAEALAGRIEARGIGVLDRPWRAFARIDLVVRLLAGGTPERLPEPDAQVIEGVAVPRIELCAQEASAVAKLALALSHIGLSA